MDESVVTQVDVARKLLEHFHANVAERRVVPKGGMPFSTFMHAARQALEECPFLPAKLRPHEIFDGIILEVRAGEHWIHERFEVGVNRFSELESRRAADLSSAVRSYLERFKGNIDGVPVDWEA